MKHMAEAAAGAQARVAADHGGHQLVGVQAALHQRLGLAQPHQLDGARGGGVAVRRIDDAEAGEVDFQLFGDGANLVTGPTSQGWMIPAWAASITAASEGVTGMRHRRGGRRRPLAAGDERLVFLVAAEPRLRELSPRAPELLGGRDDLGRARDHLRLRSGWRTGNRLHMSGARYALRPSRVMHGERVSGADRPMEAQGLAT